VRALLRLVYGATLRGLIALGGAVAGYGATWMFTTSGVMPSNALVIAGLVLCALAAAALFRAERRATGIWPALLIVSLPFSLYALSSLGVPECPQPHPLLTAAYTCAPVGSHALAVIAPLISSPVCADGLGSPRPRAFPAVGCALAIAWRAYRPPNPEDCSPS